MNSFFAATKRIAILSVASVALGAGCDSQAPDAGAQKKDTGSPAAPVEKAGGEAEKNPAK